MVVDGTKDSSCIGLGDAVVFTLCKHARRACLEGTDSDRKCPELTMKCVCPNILVGRTVLVLMHL